MQKSVEFRGREDQQKQLEKMMFMENIDIQTSRRSLASLTARLPCVFQGKFFITSAISSIRKGKEVIIAEFFAVLHSKAPSYPVSTFLRDLSGTY